MSDTKNNGRFVAQAEDVKPLGRPVRSEDLTSAEDRKARTAARKALEEAQKGEGA
jgi:hypothetical protein